MTDYYFAIENTPMPIYEIPDYYENAAPSTIFTFPKSPIPILARYKPEEKYEITDLIIQPDFLLLTKRLLNTATHDSINLI